MTLRTLSCGTLLLIVALEAGAVAQQPDAGWKIRMDYPSKYMPGRNRPRSLARSNFVSAAPSMSRSVSAQPAFRAGDRVKVSGDHAQMMDARRALGHVPRGTELAVEQVSGNWLLTRFEAHGQSWHGWLSSAEVAPSGR